MRELTQEMYLQQHALSVLLPLILVLTIDNEPSPATSARAHPWETDKNKEARPDKGRQE